MKKLVALSTLSLVIAAGPSFAEEQVASAELSFNVIDLNADGYISSEEAYVYEPLSVQFSTLDTDEDGLISESEFNELDQSTL